MMSCSNQEMAGTNSFIPFDEGWKAIKAKTSKFLENIEGGMTKDSYKIPAKEFVAIYKYTFPSSHQSLLR
jgi:hypothetical protein